MHHPDIFSMSGDLKDLLGKLACNPALHHLARLRQMIEYNTERAENEPQAFLDMQFLNAIYDSTLKVGDSDYPVVLCLKSNVKV